MEILDFIKEKIKEEKEKKMTAFHKIQDDLERIFLNENKKEILNFLNDNISKSKCYEELFIKKFRDKCFDFQKLIEESYQDEIANIMEWFYSFEKEAKCCVKEIENESQNFNEFLGKNIKNLINNLENKMEEIISNKDMSKLKQKIFFSYLYICILKNFLKNTLMKKALFGINMVKMPKN